MKWMELLERELLERKLQELVQLKFWAIKFKYPHADIDKILQDLEERLAKLGLEP